MSSQGFTWDQPSTRLLILLYEANPNLYSTNNTNYKLKNKRQDALKNIRLGLIENGFSPTIEEINKKIHNLRTQFFKEYSKVKQRVVSGAGTSDLYVPKVWWYDYLQFLISSDPVKKSSSNLNEPGSSKTDSEPIYIPNSPESSSVNEEIENIVYETTIEELEEGVYVPHVGQKPKRQKKSSIEEETKGILKDAANALNVISNSKIGFNECKAFTDMIAEEMTKIDSEEELRTVKRQILNCVLDAQERLQRSKN